MHDDLEFLVQETMNLAGSMKGHNPFMAEVVYPEGPGLLYRLEKGASTFVLRILEASSIKESMELLNGSEQLKKLLRVTDETLSSVQYFETPSREVALSVKEKVANKRFPLEEQTLCNLSDPGFSWWISTGANSINISFKNYRLDEVGGYQSLGALGDPKISAAKLNNCQSLLRELFPVGHFFCNENLFGLETTSAGSMAFEKFKRLFLEGRDLEELFDLSVLHQKHHASLTFLREISFVRKFWRAIESELKN